MVFGNNYAVIEIGEEAEYDAEYNILRVDYAYFEPSVVDLLLLADIANRKGTKEAVVINLDKAQLKLLTEKEVAHVLPS